MVYIIVLMLLSESFIQNEKWELAMNCVFFKLLILCCCGRRGRPWATLLLSKYICFIVLCNCTPAYKHISNVLWLKSIDWLRRGHWKWHEFVLGESCTDNYCSLCHYCSVTATFWRATFDLSVTGCQLAERIHLD